MSYFGKIYHKIRGVLLAWVLISCSPTLKKIFLLSTCNPIFIFYNMVIRTVKLLYKWVQGLKPSKNIKIYFAQCTTRKPRDQTALIEYKASDLMSGAFFKPSITQ